ncbi:MAG: cyclic nucleotide-binding domain-containing protein [Candidatus Firestonebacteria bacterium]
MEETEKARGMLGSQPPVVDVFLNHPNFAQFSKEELKIFTACCKEKKLNEDEILFSEGEPGLSMYIVKKGGIKILKMGFLGETAIARIHPGEFVGEMAVIDSSPRSATVKATARTELLELSQENYYALKKDSPKVAIKIMDLLLRLLSLRLRSTTSNLLKK